MPRLMLAWVAAREVMQAHGHVALRHSDIALLRLVARMAGMRCAYASDEKIRRMVMSALTATPGELVSRREAAGMWRGRVKYVRVFYLPAYAPPEPKDPP